MRFPEKVFRLISVRTFSKDGKDYTFVKLADTMTFENNDFMLSKDTKADSLVPHSDYKVVLDVDGRFSSVILTPSTSVKGDAK